jgi:predicted metal-dependent peptidase
VEHNQIGEGGGFFSGCLLEQICYSEKKQMSNKQSTDNGEIPTNTWGQEVVPNEHFSDREHEGVFFLLYQHEPFLAGISMEMSKIPDPKCATAYVAVSPNGELSMGYNPYFFRSLEDEQRKGVIIHELYHVILMHLMERNISDRDYAKAWNIATDLAINSIIDRKKLPDFALIPGVRPRGAKDSKLVNFIENAKPGLASEFYFEQIKQIIEESGEEPDLDTLDDHNGWGYMPDLMRDQITDKLRNAVQNAVNRADSKNSWGSVPMHMQQAIRKLLEKEINWREVIKYFFGTARNMTRISTIKRVSRKLPGILPGVKRGISAKFAFFIDQSGSMGDDDIALAFSEVENASNEMSIDVFNFDTSIDEDSHKIWSRGKKFEWQRTRGGGTNFDAVADFVNSPQNRNKWSGVVILTDGYAPTMSQVFAKVLWIITPNGATAAARPGDLVVQLRKEAKVVKM